MESSGEQTWFNVSLSIILGILALAKALRAYETFPADLLRGMLHAVTACALLVLLAKSWRWGGDPEERRAEMERLDSWLTRLSEAHPVQFNLLAVAVAGGLLAFGALLAL